MPDIGGYFELELPVSLKSYHTTPYAFKNGRSSLLQILLHVKPSLVYLPYYSCDAVVEPFEITGIPYVFYRIDDSFAPVALPDLKAGEYFLYINYHGIKQPVIKKLSEQYGSRLIIDATQAFYERGDGRSWLFNSCRKFFGVPDGSYLYAPGGETPAKATTHNEGFVFDHLVQRLGGDTNGGYRTFLRNEEMMTASQTGMSVVSERILSNIDYSGIAAQRRKNYGVLCELLSSENEYDAEMDDNCVPMYYPLVRHSEAERHALTEQHIYIPVLWKDVLTRGIETDSTEAKITRNLWPLPIDHRLSTNDMVFLAGAVKKLIDKK